MANFKTLFEAYGADYEFTMKRFLNNEAMYLKFLSKLPADPNLQRLGEALDRGDLTDAFEAAHTLKGVAGNLGLAPLYGAVGAITELLRAGEARDYTGMYQAVRREFTRAMELCDSVERGK